MLFVAAIILEQQALQAEPGEQPPARTNAAEEGMAAGGELAVV